MNPETPQQNTPITPQPQYTQASQPVPTSVGSKAMAITALVLAILGFLTGFLFIGIILAAVALILSIIGLVKKKPGKGLNIASVIISGLCILSLPILLSIWIASYNGISERANDAALEAQLSN